MKLKTKGLRHVALFIKNFDACVTFYEKILGMEIMWKPDADNVYLTTGYDNLALHRARPDFTANQHQHLDHLGFFLETEDEVDEWHTYMILQEVTIKAPPKNHRDGTKSFYCADPDGNVIQMIYYPFIRNDYT